MEQYIEMYGEKIVNNNCFQRLLYQEMGMNRRNDLSDKLRDLLLKNVTELDKILNEGIASGEFKRILISRW
ncbi:hypothetical protein HK413_05715 [Mucilaginibacter sp. S1162]|uniref:Uncharacterized protein n=1 Tax=Mucilaginibacter humi TaxID=2732510 RepID=A0ABX1W0L7_9SPHI|nr:hypothetical protein [Mucilaginibacter humi]NNU33761.1 hypothetical protein [Mucilaginibacter humi]